MWKLVLGFVLFAALAMFMLKNAGGDVDMGGEKHGIDSHPATVAPTPAPGASK